MWVGLPIAKTPRSVTSTRGVFGVTGTGAGPDPSIRNATIQ